MFVHWVEEDRGSAQDMCHYARVARELGHEVTLFGRPNGKRFDYSLDLDAADAAIFIFEWTTDLQDGDNLDLLRLAAKVPRERRVIIDCDGKYNDAISVVGDYNHPDAAASERWIAICNSLSDKIYQPTLHPMRPNVRSFFFHAYSPTWETPLNFADKSYAMYYVGNNWFRWRAMRRILDAVEPIRDEVGRLAVVGLGWESPGPWANPTISEDAYYIDPSYLERLNVEVLPAIRFDRVIDSMGKGVFMPVIYRPLFDHLRLVTCRTFETPAANTIPLFGQDAAYVESIYGEEALELVLPYERPQDKILDVVCRPEHYARLVSGVRQRLTERYSYMVQLQQLIQIVES